MAMVDRTRELEALAAEEAKSTGWAGRGAAA
jgi:hypothetical protein